MAPHWSLLASVMIVELTVEFASKVACVGITSIVLVVICLSLGSMSVAMKLANAHRKRKMKAENAMILGLQIYLSLFGILYYYKFFAVNL
jgi:hypothetical protein